MQSSSNEDSSSLQITRKMVRDFENRLKLSEQENEEEKSLEDIDEEDDNDEEFSFALDSLSLSPVAAEDVFQNGQIKPFFPLFNRDLIFPDGEDFESLKLRNRLPNVNKVFIAADDDEHSNFVRPETLPSSEDAEDGHIVGPYCEWSKKVVVEASQSRERCKKSNSTGSSRIWKFKDFMHRSNSDGRDAFVFLNHSTTPSSSKREEAAAAAEAEAAQKEKENTSSKKVVNVGNSVAGKGKKVVKGKTAPLSAHEAYMKSKSKDAERRQSYLPYRRELVWLFTNVNGGGLSKNVHPF